MKLKILRRSVLIYNAILFQFLSFGIIHLQSAFKLDIPAVQVELFIQTLSDNYLLVLGLILSSILVFRLAKNCHIIFFLFQFSIVARSLYLMDGEFHKLILILLFLLVTISYYYTVFIKVELGQAHLNPTYTGKELFDPMLNKFNCQVEIGDKSYGGIMTNWNHSGCFIRLNDKLDNKAAEAKFSFSIGDRVFNDIGYITSTFGDKEGVGLDFMAANRKNQDKFNWLALYQILNSRGLTPESSR